MYQFDQYQLRVFIESCAKVAVATFIREREPDKDLITQRAAYGLFGETRVRRWANDGLITPHRKGTAKNSRKEYSRAELNSVLASELARDAHQRYNTRTH